MAINNLNPRRAVWFSPHEPSNKYDIWLSKNAHLDENGEPTTDSNAQRGCDYIFKIYDCGKWNPIIGFNSTAKYKINVVNEVEYTYAVPNTLVSQTNTGFLQNHLPLFRNPEDSPDELFDAGTLGEALYGFVSEQEWNTLFNANWFQSAFNTSIIGGNDYNWSTLINSNIDFATTSQCGGILSDIHTYDTVSAFKPIEVKFYPTTSAYSSKLHRLCVSASDVIEQINSYYNDNPSGQSLSIPLATTSTIGGIKSDVHSYGVTSAFKPVECKFYPNQGTWSSLYERLCINANDVIDLFIASFDSEYPLLIGGNGITLGLTLDHSQITWEVSNLRYAEAGKYARSLVVNGDHTIEWVDLPEYEELDSSSTDENLYVVRGLDRSNKQNYLLGGNGKWIEKGYGLSVVLISDSEFKIDQNIHKQNDVEIDDITDKYIVFETSNTPIGDEMVNISYDNTGLIVSEYQYKKITISATQKALHFKNISNTEYTNPISIKIIASEDIDLEFTDTKYIYEGDTSLSILPQGTEWLLTFQFGVVKFEKIITPQ